MSVETVLAVLPGAGRILHPDPLNSLQHRSRHQCRINLRGNWSGRPHHTTASHQAAQVGGVLRNCASSRSLVAYGEGLIAILIPDIADETTSMRLRRLRKAFGDRGYMALTLRQRPNDQMRLWELSNLAASLKVPEVVTNGAPYREPSRHLLHDVVTAIRHSVTIDELGSRRERFADRYLKPPEEMARLLTRYPEAVARTIEIMERSRGLSETCNELR